MGGGGACMSLKKEGMKKERWELIHLSVLRFVIVVFNVFGSKINLN